MIRKVDQKSLAIAENIWEIFQASYAVEAELLKAIDFPPLKRSPEAISSSKTDFLGYYLGTSLVAVIEINHQIRSTHIRSLVVHPNYFRRGIGQKLVNFILATCVTKTYTVETGLGNVPAIKLYKKLGFIETAQRDTDHGIRKVQMKKS